MQYRPEHTDLLEAIQEFLLKDILPFVKEEDMLAYKTLVSWNMLGVVARELKNARPLLEEDTRALARIVGTEVNPTGLGDRELWQSAQRLSKTAAQKLRASKALPGSAEWAAVKEIVKHNLQIANPRFGAE
ncbi:MAG: hypothetical protein JSR44_05950 [Spirochaetes bacterium]|nr:hypothetical protein [Spirochaetota bacterium]